MGIDVGGTFVDLLLVDKKAQITAAHKVIIGDKIAECVVEGLYELGSKIGLRLKDLLKKTELILHGTTTTTNVIINRSGSRTALITTKGFRDYIDMQKGVKKLEFVFDLKKGKEKSIVPRCLVFSLDERIDASGDVLEPIKVEDLNQIESLIISHRVQSVGITLMNSYVNPLHEIIVKDHLSSRFSDRFITASHEIYPEIGIYERTNTTALNAYVGPAVVFYMINLTNKLYDLGFKGKFLIMQSDGSLANSEIVKKSPIQTIQSGPAAGAIATRYIASLYRIGNLIFADMGGVSFDVSLIVDGNLFFSPEKEILHHYIRIPSIDVVSIGAGGGSIAWIDAGGILRVGPKSAGADPGPICYGKGGEEPTVTDANLILGLINPDLFYGGKYKLDTEKPKEILKKRIGDPFGIDEIEASFGIFEVINSNMADTIRMISLERGYDPSDFALLISGGAGPLHASYIADELKIPLVIIPDQSSVFSAKGMLISDVEHEFVKSILITLSDNTEKKKIIDKINFYFWYMTRGGIATLKSEGFPKNKMEFKYFVDLRYPGQIGKLSIQIEEENLATNSLEELINYFHEKHRETFGFSLEDSEVELVNLRVRATGIIEKPPFKDIRWNITTENPIRAIKGQRSAFIPEKADFDDLLVFDSSKLESGNRILGPALIEHPYTTIFLSTKYQAVVDEHRNYLILNKKNSLDSVVKAMRGEVK